MSEDKNQIAEAIVRAAVLLGNGNAITPMGAIEALSVVHKQGLAEIADVHKEGLESIADALNNISVSIDELSISIKENV